MVYMDCTSYYNANNLCVCYGFESALDDLFLKDKVTNTAACGGIAIGSNIVILLKHDQVQMTVLVICMQYQINLSNPEIITQHLTDMEWNPKYNKSILEILNDSTYFSEKTQKWCIGCCIH